MATMSNDDRDTMIASLSTLLERHWSPMATNDYEAIASVSQALAAAGWHRVGRDSATGGLRLIVDILGELGRAACPAPILPAMLACGLDGASDDGMTTSLVIGAFEGDPVSGDASLVEDSFGASRFLIVAGNRIGFVDAGAHGIDILSTPGMAEPALATVTFDQVPVRWIGDDARHAADLDLLYRLGLAARACGSANRVTHLATEHAKVRKQFGRQIGSFQAVQHKLADCHILVEAARLAIENAAMLHDQGEPWRFAAAATIAFATDRLRQVALEAQHVLGAIGYAEDHEAPRHFRRIHVDLCRLGGARRARREIAEELFRSGFPARSLGQKAEGFAAEVRRWIDETAGLDDGLSEQPELDWNRHFSRRLGARGWIAAAWSTAHGGEARSPLELFALAGALETAELPTSAHVTSAGIVAPTLIAYGSAEQQAAFLPAIARGELSFCLGYSEPEAGSDLSALRTQAIRDGDDYIVNGQKLWTSGGELADYVLLAVRTDPKPARRQDGISLLMVPLDSPGITIRPTRSLHGGTFCTVFYDDVRVPMALRIGEENGGWPLLGAALATERVQLGGVVARLQHILERLIEWVKTSGAPDDGVARETIGRLAAEIEASFQLALRAIRVMETGTPPIVEGAVTKVFTGELMERLCESALDIVGGEALLSAHAPGAALAGKLEKMVRKSLMYVIGGGTNEIQRTIIAERGLGLPR